MSLRILILFITSLSMFTLLIAANPQSKEPGDTTSSSKTQHTRTRATAKITFQSSEAKPYDQTTSPALTEIHIVEMFTGDIDGESTVRALALQRDDKSASQVSMQRFIGKLAGRQGAFVLQGSEIVKKRQDQGDLVCCSRIWHR